MKNLFSALRPSSWIKNLFVFLPLIFGRKLFVYPSNLETLAAFVLFCINASGAYLINDIIDLEQDRIHPVKRLRPIASGKVPIKQAKIAACILCAVSIGLSFFMNYDFGLAMSAYLALNFLYSKILKKLVIIDVFCLGGFFLLRIIAGGIIAGVTLSHWIVFMTMLLALFLGFNKRGQELKLLKREAHLSRKVLLKYNSYFIDQMSAVLMTSVVLVYMLYTVDRNTVALFGTKNLIYSIPCVYYGIFRYLYLIHKSDKEGDPTNILVSDRMMQLNILVWISICIAVIYL
jgi:4-hydroxybenzoate polyprenyltransferase